MGMQCSRELLGLLGGMISSIVCLAPLPLFYEKCKSRRSDGVQSIPHAVALFKAKLWILYAILGKDSTLLIIVYSFNFVVEIGYISVYLFYATKKDKIFTVMLLLLNVFGFGLVCAIVLVFTHDPQRIKLLNWLCMIFTLLSVLVAYLQIMKEVIQTKKVESIPLYLSLCQILSAVLKFIYGYLKKNLFFAVPNILSLIIGVTKLMALYVIYRNSASQVNGANQNLSPSVQEVLPPQNLNTV